MLNFKHFNCIFFNYDRGVDGHTNEARLMMQETPMQSHADYL